jgi:hypothetical protein
MSAMLSMRAKRRAPGRVSSGSAEGRAGLALRILLAVSAAAVVAAAGNGRCFAQQSSMGNQTLGRPFGFPQDDGTFSSSGDEVGSVDAERRLNALNNERQKSLTADAGRLLKLAAELNHEIAQSNSGALTPDELRMVAEIEKLAHNVRDKMAMSLRGPQYPGLEMPIEGVPQASHH